MKKLAMYRTSRFISAITLIVLVIQRIIWKIQNWGNNFYFPNDSNYLGSEPVNLTLIAIGAISAVVFVYTTVMLPSIRRNARNPHRN